jgi:hypothetical protein
VGYIQFFHEMGLKYPYFVNFQNNAEKDRPELADFARLLRVRPFWQNRPDKIAGR